MNDKDVLKIDRFAIVKSYDDAMHSHRLKDFFNALKDNPEIARDKGLVGYIRTLIKAIQQYFRYYIRSAVKTALTFFLPHKDTAEPDDFRYEKHKEFSDDMKVLWQALDIEPDLYRDPENIKMRDYLIEALEKVSFPKDITKGMMIKDGKFIIEDAGIAMKPLTPGQYKAFQEYINNRLEDPVHDYGLLLKSPLPDGSLVVDANDKYFLDFSADRALNPVKKPAIKHEDIPFLDKTAQALAKEKLLGLNQNERKETTVTLTLDKKFLHEDIFSNETYVAVKIPTGHKQKSGFYERKSINGAGSYVLIRKDLISEVPGSSVNPKWKDPVLNIKVPMDDRCELVNAEGQKIELEDGSIGCIDAMTLIDICDISAVDSGCPYAFRDDNSTILDRLNEIKEICDSVGYIETADYIKNVMQEGGYVLDKDNIWVINRFDGQSIVTQGIQKEDLMPYMDKAIELFEKESREPMQFVTNDVSLQETVKTENKDKLFTDDTLHIDYMKDDKHIQVIKREEGFRVFEISPSSIKNSSSYKDIKDLNELDMPESVKRFTLPEKRSMDIEKQENFVEKDTPHKPANESKDKKDKELTR